MTDTPRSVIEVRALAAWVGKKVKTLTARIENAVQGDDPRLSDARTPTAHRHDAADIDNLPEGGGGGAGIDDAVTAPDKTWSSEKTAAELAGKAAAGWNSELPMFGGDRGAPVPTGMTVDQGIDGAFGTAVSLAGDMVTITDFTGTITEKAINVADAGSGVPLEPGKLYAIRAADGIVTWRLP